MRSAIAVDPTRSQNSTVTSLRSPAIVPWMPRIFWARSFGMWRDSRSRRFSQASALKVGCGGSGGGGAGGAQADTHFGMELDSETTDGPQLVHDRRPTLPQR